MRLIIEAGLADEGSDTGHDVDGVLAVIERRDCSLAQLGLNLAEGRSNWPRCRRLGQLRDVTLDVSVQLCSKSANPAPGAAERNTLVQRQHFLEPTTFCTLSSTIRHASD
ncbi:hypothetical protein CS8_009330 [Cupriavidus sp. 8B]